MPHSKPLGGLAAPNSRSERARGDHGASRKGALVVAALSASILGGATLVARPEHGASNGFFDGAWQRVGISLGLATRQVELVPDSQGATASRFMPRIVVTGRILDAEGHPVAGAAVRVRSDAQPGWDWVASSSADGSFRADGVTLGKVHVEARDIEAGSVESAVLEADEARHVVLVLEQTIEVTGAVFDDRGAPIARAAVKRPGRAGKADRVVVADEEGRFAIRGEARSFERLVVWARGFEATTIALGDITGAAVRRDVRLHAARPLHGSVVAPSGEAVPFARVSACAGEDIQMVATDASGAFELPATAMGCWVTAVHSRFAPARPLRIGDGRDMVVRLGAGGAIEGMAVDERKRPIGSFSVTIASFEAEESAPGVPTRTGETSDYLRGSFRLSDLAPGTYVLRLRSEGKLDTDSQPIAVGRNRVVRGEQLVLMSAEAEDGAFETEAESAESAEGAETAELGAADEPAEAPPQ
jgi:hypothetical protein